jgi:2',3'-cyclic-nucleotide 2'-phosphodiesterase (5'-nucleotidase family)
VIRRSLALGLAAAFTSVVLLFAPHASGDDPKEKKVTFLFTTDIHGHYLPHVSIPRSKDETKAPEPKRTGGMAAIQAEMKAVRAATHNPVFLFDSGDVMTGHPVCDFEYDGITGGALFAMMNAIGYDAWCIGNHDFDHGRPNVAKICNYLKFPTLSANLVVEGEPALKISRWTILEKDGVKVGVFGLILDSLMNVVAHDKVPGISTSKAVNAAREAVAALTSKCDVIVALSHCGSDDDIKLVDQVPGIDVVLSGHNHMPLKAARHGKTIVTEGFLKAARLGRLDLTLKADGEIAFAYRSFAPADAPPEGDLKPILEAVDAAIGSRLKEVIAKLADNWSRNNKGESNIGDFFTDGLRTQFKADVAFLNAGGIRENLHAGDVTLGDVNEIFPNDNQVVAFELTGEDLVKTIEKNASAAVGNEYGVLQCSGIRYEFERHGKKAKVTKTECGGQPIDPKKTYRCVATDFIAIDQHEKYLGEVTVSKLEKLDVTMTKVAEDYVRAEGKKGPIKSAVDGRMGSESR